MADNTQTRERERDLVLNPRQYAYILDLTKGQVSVYVGPLKTSLSDTDRPVRVRKGEAGTAPVFDQCRLEDSIQEFPSADEGGYIVLENPHIEKEADHPGTGPNTMAKLNYGRKINLPGPVSFPLWPGQVSKVIPGHNLRTNQYLKVRIYNGEVATANQGQAIMIPVEPGSMRPVDDSVRPADDSVQADKEPAKQQTLVTGQIIHIRGTEVSFYIPPTGFEVVPDGDSYVRSAATLERLEFCVLLGENGDRRFVRGPAVVFPEPTETFITKDGSNKFRAIELNENSGVYVKVIAPYKDGEASYKEGDELFITGKEQMIYFPRPEHTFIRYGEQIKHYAIAIPEGEARYVLDKQSGQVSLIRGPKMFLPDPRTQVIVRRVLDPKLAALMYPGNAEAVAENTRLAALAAQQRGSGFVTARAATRGRAIRSTTASTDDNIDAAALGVLSDYAVLASAQAWEASDKTIDRSPSYTAPASITVDAKYEGAVCMTIWAGYSVLLMSKSGARRVVSGPQTVLLEYDETPQVVEFATGVPKTDKSAKVQSVYLRAAHNHVSDRVDVVTKDMVNIVIDLAYRVSFEGDSNKWFDVENYVVFLCDHLRSLIRNAAKQHGIEQFNLNAINIIRDAILGTSEDGKRPGRKFEENGMRVYDVEVLNTTIGDAAIGKLLVMSQHQAVEQALTVASKERELNVTQRTEDIARQIAAAKSATALHLKELEKATLEAGLVVSQQKLAGECAVAEQMWTHKRKEQFAKLEGQKIDALTEQAIESTRLTTAKDKQALEMAELTARTEAEVQKLKALSPEFMAAISAFGDKLMVEKLMEALGPHALLQGKSVADVLAQLINGTPGFGDRLSKLLPGGKPGQ